MTPPFLDELAVSRRRLESLIARLSEADYARTTPYGWSIAALFGHMAFWDQRVLVLLRRWKAHGVDASPVDADAMNDALRPICDGLPPLLAAELCLASAAQVDAELAATSEELFAQIEAEMHANPFQFRANRALHRNAHLDDIERLLGNG
ncbi:MAG: maleylpyruvate isomerase N-terminal domain-containing protein [Chloroflexi bacterium]|nr:maleylpyruvate isomerase N-terminal domain-containing protein [Chloroflexota bacterium]